MSEFEFRPGFGRESAAQPLKQHKASQIKNNSFESAGSFLLQFTSKKRSVGQFTLALLTGCIVTILAGCGGASHSLGTNALALSTISCGTQSMTGAQSMTCVVNLTAAPMNATTVTLASSNAALNVPAAVMVAAGAKTAGFTAVSEAVSQTVSVTITGEAGSVTKTDKITLYPVASSAPQPAATLSKVSCGAQTLTGPATDSCTVYLSAAATNPTEIALSSSSTALQAPASVTVAAGSTSATFSATASAVTAAAKATLTATADGMSQTDVIQLDAAAAQPSTQHEVQLNWDAPPPTSDPVVGYHVYRSPAGASNYALVFSSPDTQTNYGDSTVTGGVTYNYIVKSVDNEGVESIPSNSISVAVP
ncbi:MAG: fibronectin type III domain-containing protein [Terracidiphilus sp.]